MRPLQKEKFLGKSNFPIKKALNFRFLYFSNFYLSYCFKTKSILNHKDFDPS